MPYINNLSFVEGGSDSPIFKELHGLNNYYNNNNDDDDDDADADDDDDDAD